MPPKKRHKSLRALRKYHKHAGTARSRIAVARIRDRETGEVRARVGMRTDAATHQGFVEGNTVNQATVYTYEANAHRGIARPHATVNHGAGLLKRSAP